MRIAEVKKKFVRLCAEKSQWREKRLGIIQQVHNKIPNKNKETSSSSVERRVKILPKSERKAHSTASTLLNLDENNAGEIRSLNYIPDKNSFFLTGVAGGDPSQGGHQQISSYSQPQSKIISSLTTIDSQVKSRNDLDFGKDELQIQLEMSRAPGSTKRGSILKNGLSIIHESSSSKQSISIMTRKSQLEKSIQSLAEKKKTIDYNTGSGAPEVQISRRASSRVSISGNFRDMIAKELYHKNLFEKVDHGEKENSMNGGSFSCVHTPVKNRQLISNLFKSHRGDPKTISLAQENYTPGPDMSALLHQRSSRAQSNSLSNRNLHVDNGFKNQARRVVKSSEKRYRSPEQDLSEIIKIHKGLADMSYSSRKEIVADIREEHKRLKILLKKPEKTEKKRPKFMIESAKRPQRFDALNYYLPTNRVSARYPGENVSELSSINNSGVKGSDHRGNKSVKRPRLGQESSVISNENREKSVDFECKSVRIPISVRARSNLKNRSFF